jgi:hypothetical protein
VDSSPSPKTVTVVGNVQRDTTTTDPFGRTGVGVLAFDGNGDRMSVPVIKLNNDFTIEAFLRFNALSDTIVFAGDTIFTQLMRFNLAAGRFDSSAPGGSIFANVSTGVTTNTWYHVALVRSGTTFYFFLDGQQIAINSSPPSGVQGQLTLQWFGDAGNANYNPLNGYMDEVRCTTVARYTANFTPPTAPFPDI